MPRILVVGEHSLYRMGFCALIKENFTNVEVLETGSITEAVAHIRSDRGVQLVLIDLELSRSPSFNLIKSACNNAHDTRLVTISATNNRVDIHRFVHMFHRRARHEISHRFGKAPQTLGASPAHFAAASFTPKRSAISSARRSSGSN